MRYREEINSKDILKVREMLKELPEFLREFFTAVSDTTTVKTRLSYAYDLKIFFNYLSEEVNIFKNKPVKSFSVEDLEIIKASHISEFMSYLTYYSKKDANGNIKYYHNAENGKSRKLASVRSMLNFFYKREKIKANPGRLVDTPKIHQKSIVRLEPEEASELLDEVEKGDNLTKRQKKIHEYTKTRDLAIITLLLGTGMRVSECVGIDIKHINFKVNGIAITRKGGNEVILYFGDEVEQALKAYLEERKKIKALSGNEDALFLSMQNKRISVRAVQNMVKKYSSLITSFKNISPHKLRSTYGTTLYRQTGDIYLVADVLGHSDVNTTRKHYAEMDDANRRKAARVVKFRSE